MTAGAPCEGGVLDQVGCIVGGTVGETITDTAGALAGSAIDAFVKSLAEDVEEVLATVSTMWMGVPSPVLAADDAPTGVVAAISDDLSFYTMVFGIIGVLFAAGKMGLTRRAEEAEPIGRMLVTLTIVSSAGAAIVAAAVGAGDLFAPWIIQRATGGSFSEGALSLVSTSMVLGVGRGLGLILGLAALLGSIAQVIFMIFRGAMITLLVSVLPTIAATSATQGGSAALRKAFGWLLAFVLYKPVAAIVYAVGFLLVKGAASTAPADAGQATLMSVLYGVTILLLACLTLPALVKFLVPVASAGVSSLFSGAAAGAAALATGAAVVSMASTGAGAAAAGARTTGAGAKTASTKPAAAPAAAPRSGATPSPAPATPAASRPAAGAPPQANPAGGRAPAASAAPGATGNRPSASGGRESGARWTRAAQAGAEAARTSNTAAEEGGAGPTGAQGR